MVNLRPSTPKVNRSFGWGLFILSIALHSLLLRLPMRPLGELTLPESEPEPPELVPVTRLPEVAPPVVEQPIEPPEPEPPEPEPEAPPELPPEPIAQPFDDILIEPEVIEPEANEPDPLEPDPLEPEPPDPLEPEPPDPDPLNPDPPLEGGTVVPFADDFPHLADAQVGCDGLENCRILPSATNYRTEARRLQQSLEEQGYQVEVEDIDIRRLRVYRVSNPNWRNGETYYLSVFQDAAGQALYAITAEIMTLDELRQRVSTGV